ncbi:MAG: hypothetical protein M1823_000171 [Watsoniomyces obsoletus]|nr:MAG: hypothetical protein M1823_000171 [Watsoniomyces obsoletus]
MWLLECDGDVFENKRLWLRPGKKYLFGRTKHDQGSWAIEDRTISRKHLTIQVDQVNPGDGLKVHARLRITIEDQGSKYGTLLNGKQVTGQAEIRQGDEHTIQLGNYIKQFRIRWHPVVLTFSFSSAENEKPQDPMLPIREKLEALDIKTVIPYLQGTTTHVVSAARNTSKALRALIDAKYIVARSYVDALAEAARSPDPDDPERVSPLEKDFDAAWPDPMQHVPPESNAPVKRPTELFAPNPSRANVFEGYTFVFCQRKQFNTLQAPIAVGGGKALLYEVEYPKTTADDIVRYMREVAATKGTDFEDGSDGRGVVLVRFRVDEAFDWSINLSNDVAQALNQRVIEQSEFLDAIVMCDASPLRRPLPEDDEEMAEDVQHAGARASKNITGGAASSDVRALPEAQPAAIATEPRTTRNRTRRLVRSQFKGFDDGFDPADLPSMPKKFEGATQASQAGGAMDIDAEPALAPNTQAGRGRKRPTPMSEEEEPDEEVMDRILPAAAAMKRRRIEEEKDGRGRTVADSPASAGSPEAKQRKGSGRRVEKEIDVRAVAREHREAEDEAVMRDEEAMRAANEGLEVEKMKNLALIEEMPVKVRTNRSNRGGEAVAEGGPRWDDRWNGRKNFKKFRRRGADVTEAPRRGGHRTVIVGLEEVKKGRGFGFNEEMSIGRDRSRIHHLDTPTTSVAGYSSTRHREQKSRTTTTKSQSGRQPAPFSTVGTRTTPMEVDDIKSSPEPMEISAPPAPPSRVADKTNITHGTATTASLRTEVMTPTSSIPNKRTASSASLNRPGVGGATGPTATATKKQKKLFAQQSDHSDDDNDSDEEDELRFRFNRRGK